MQSILVLIFPLAALATPLFNPPTTQIIPDDPSQADPPTPPKTLSAPPKAPNPYPFGIPTHPESCDGQNPSRKCFNDLDAQVANSTTGTSLGGGYIYFDKNSGCSEDQKGVLTTASWDASTLASYASNFPTSAHGIAAAKYYMGPDWQSQTGRLTGNFQRAAAFQTTGSSRQYITVSCTDTKGYCPRTIDSKGVGGYAWSYTGWFGYEYYYITLCPIFFGLDDLNDRFADVENDISNGRTNTASDMAWLKSTGQFFLHEMMHLNLVSGKEPHIIDEYVDPEGHGPRAYGAYYIWRLAQRTLRNGGGVTRASTNADSYAVLANAKYWWDTTGYFPEAAKPYATSLADTDTQNAPPLSIWVDLDNATDPTTANWASLFDSQIQSLNNTDEAPDQ